MGPALRQRLVGLAKFIAAKVLRREIVLLPLNVGNGFPRPSGNGLLPVRYDYRASAEGVVTYRMFRAGTALTYELYAATYAADFQPARGQKCFSCSVPVVEAGDELRVSLTQPDVWLNDRPITFRAESADFRGRKYIAELQLSAGTERLTRSCFHYLPYENKSIGEEYYFGDDYVDYPQQQAAEVRYLVGLARKYRSGGRLLEIGCALGLSTSRFLEAGFDAYGLDVSSFAVGEAAKRVGANRVRQCNVDEADIPFQGVFDVVFMWDVLEHSSNPAAMIEKVSARSLPGAWLFLRTSNAGSLTHRLFGKDWEGYSDYSHYGVDQVSAASLRSWLGNCGWDIVEWQCQDMWIAPIDRTILRLRQLFMWFPELVTLLRERDLGDFIQVVAQKEPSNVLADPGRQA